MTTGFYINLVLYSHFQSVQKISSKFVDNFFFEKLLFLHHGAVSSALAAHCKAPYVAVYSVAVTRCSRSTQQLLYIEPG